MNGSLFLSPQRTQDVCSQDILISTLKTLQIIANPLDTSDSPNIFEAGEGFPRQVVFAGCSPHLRFTPAHAGDRHFCHVALHGPYEEARVLIGENTVKPRCPHCRQRLGDWSERLTNPNSPCPGCSTELSATELDWRQHAAVGRCFVELRNVFPGEASPSDQLLAELHKTSGFAWQYAWAGMFDENESIG